MKKTFRVLTSLAMAMVLVIFTGCGTKDASEVGQRIDALDDSAWDASIWISVVDAPIISDHNIERAADGANWFITTLKNEKKVVSAKWMATSLGVFDIYVNGKIVGAEVLKPGYTSPIKSKLSFTYDITKAFLTAEGAENTLSAQVTPGWWADRIVSPRHNVGMRGQKCAFRGVLYGGLMKTPNGIKVIEFNARFGDPETEVVLPRLESDIYDIFCAVAEGEDVGEIKWNDKASIGIVLASKGYPEAYDKGFVIEGLDQVEGIVYHMGTALKDGNYVTNGGRVLFVTVMADTFAEAQAKANAEVAKIKCDNLFHRSDIGWQAVKYNS